MNNSFIASIHNDYISFIDIATDEELGAFVRAQIKQTKGESIPKLTGMSKALYDNHNALMIRLKECSEKKQKAANARWNNANTENKECISSAYAQDMQSTSKDNAVDMPNTNTNTNTNNKVEWHHSTSEGDNKQKESKYLKRAIQSAEYMAKKILKHTPTYLYLQEGKREETIKRWAKDIELLLRVDKAGENFEEFKAILQFSQTDPFWQKNILSGNKLRTQYSKLQVEVMERGS